MLPRNLEVIFVLLSLLTSGLKYLISLLFLACKYLLNLFTFLYVHCHTIIKPTLTSQFSYSYSDFQVHLLSGSSCSVESFLVLSHSHVQAPLAFCRVLMLRTSSCFRAPAHASPYAWVTVEHVYCGQIPTL